MLNNIRKTGLIKSKHKVTICSIYTIGFTLSGKYMTLIMNATAIEKKKQLKIRLV